MVYILACGDGDREIRFTSDSAEEALRIGAAILAALDFDHGMVFDSRTNEEVGSL